MVRGHISPTRGVEDRCTPPRLVSRVARVRLQNNRDHLFQNQSAAKSSSATERGSSSRNTEGSGEARQASARGSAMDPGVSAEPLLHPGMAQTRPGEPEEEERRMSAPRELAPSETFSPGQANAALVARGSLKSGYLWKMGANVPRWKRRYFVLKPITMLFYYMSEHDTEPRGCIDLDLFDAVRKVRGGGGGDPKKTTATHGGSSASPSSSSPSCSAAASTTFELYRSGCADGSGFMLEARGDEDWEHWVEAIANGRHGKMQAEMDVMKGANKLLLAEISGLEQQVATFRGYADQRHVTVLALRDERQRNREIAAELSSQADAASAVSHMVTAGRRARRKIGDTIGDNENDEEDDDVRSMSDGSVPVEDSARQTTLAEAALAGVPPPAAALAEPVARVGAVEALPSAGTPSSPRATVAVAAGTSTVSQRSPSSATAREREEQAEAGGGGGEGEQASLEAIRKALAEAATELGRRGAAFQVERDARVAVQSRVREADRLTRAAELRAEASEVAAVKVRGRVSVLERNVEYLQGQQRALRAELCQARHKAQLVRAQRTVLKKEIRDMREMWSRNAPRSSSLSSRAPSPPLPPPLRRPSAPPTVGRPAQRRHSQGEPMRSSRTWASMGDLAQANSSASASASAASAGPASAAAAAVAAALAAGSNGGGMKRRSMTSTSFADVAEEEEVCDAVEFVVSGGERLAVGERGLRVGRGSGSGSGSGVFRPCLSRASLAASDEGGETDFADQTMSEASDLECDNEGNPTGRSRGQSSHEAASNLFRDRVRGTIRKRVGDPRVPPLPPPRHLRVVQAIKRIPSQNVIAPKQQPEPPRGAANGGVTVPVAVAAASVVGVGPGGGGGGAAGLGVAGLFHGFRKGMVDMAAQEMGKTLARWPGGGMPTVGSLASLAAGGSTTGGNFHNFNSNNSNLNMSNLFNSSNNLQTPPASPRSATAGFSAALTDSPVRWGSSSSHGSCASSEAGTSSGARGRGGGGGGGGGGGDGVRGGTGGAAVSSPSYPIAAAAGGSTTNLLSIVAGGSSGSGGVGGLSGALTRVGSVSSRTALIQLSDLELAEPCRTKITGDVAGAQRPAGSAEGFANGTSGGGGGDAGVGVEDFAATTPNKQRTAVMSSSRPSGEEYELIFSTQVIGLQFKELTGGGVCVQGMSGYVGPTPTGFPGERLRPGIGDVLESYNGVSARGKSADVVARQLAQCGRPLRLGFRSVYSKEIVEEAVRAGGEGGGLKAEEGKRGGTGRPLLSMQRVGSPWGGGAQQQQQRQEQQRDGGGLSSCRDDVAFASPAQPWTVSS